MAQIANTAFQPKRWNNRFDDLQNVTGYFGSWADTVFTAADCAAGFICTKGANYPNNYGSVDEGGFYMTAAADFSGDLYACNTYDVMRGTIGSNLYAENFETIGVYAPSGRPANFTLMKNGETHRFGSGNFTTVPTASLTYVTIGSSSGLMLAQASVPSTGSYFIYGGVTGAFNEGGLAGITYYDLTFVKV